MKIRMLLFMSIIILGMPMLVLAEQLPNLYGVNEDTKQCVEFYGGDECETCAVPAGWTQVSACPEDYTKVGEMESVCEKKATTFCCTVDHSGSSGKCDDVVVNDMKKQCAFIEKASECEKLPSGWKIAGDGRLCPAVEYEWLEAGKVSCSESGVIGDGGGNDMLLDDKPTIVIDDDQAQNDWAIIVAIIFGLIFLAVVIYFVSKIKLKR